jgi:hypothetical protein
MYIKLKIAKAVNVMYKCIMKNYILFDIVMSCISFVLSFFVPYMLISVVYGIVVISGVVHSGHKLEKLGDGYFKTVYPEIYDKYIEYRNKISWIKGDDQRPNPMASILAIKSVNSFNLKDLDNSIIEKFNSDENIKNLKKDGSIYNVFLFLSFFMMAFTMIAALMINPAYR